jgi:hypothetical protein
MGTLLYKDHAIIAAGKRDSITGKYKPTVHIAWQTPDGRRETHSFSLPNRCATFDEASSAAVEAAKTWVDRRLIDLPS